MSRRAVPSRAERDDNFTVKCTTGPGGTFFLHLVSKAPILPLARYAALFCAPSSLPPTLSPYLPALSAPPGVPLPRLRRTLLPPSCRLFYTERRVRARVCVSPRRCLRGAMPASQRPRDFSIHFFRAIVVDLFTGAPRSSRPDEYSSRVQPTPIMHNNRRAAMSFGFDYDERAGSIARSKIYLDLFPFAQSRSDAGASPRSIRLELRARSTCGANSNSRRA